MNIFEDEDIDDNELEQRAISQSERRRQAELARHPNCRDPDHPGCEYCMEDDEL